MRLGFDIGSKNIHGLVTDGDKIIYRQALAHNGDLAGSLNRIIAEMTRFVQVNKTLYGITSSIDLAGLNSIDPIIASADAARFLYSSCRNILSIGCESFYLIVLDESGRYCEHTINSLCASGTGSFIDQQAERLGLSTEQLAEMADTFSGHTPTIATRCAVFAKTDIIHAQAQGYSPEAIAAGICEGLALNVITHVLKGRKLQGNLLVTGGVSLNRKIIREIERLVSVPVITLETGPFFNALGAALTGNETGLSGDTLNQQLRLEREIRLPLKVLLPDYPDFNSEACGETEGIETVFYQIIKPEISYHVFLGIDIGSTSTKMVMIDQNKEILLGLYTRTKGNPLKAVRDLLQRIQTLFTGQSLTIRGVGTTGSGRKLVKEMIQADLAINEITAHARGALFLDPQADTIIEIGGQDAKFIRIEQGNVTHAVMNYVCAAGTGSFIEEQAVRLNIPLNLIAEMADAQKAPFTSDRCTVYMERDLNILLSEGYSRNEIIASVLYSVRDNYLSKVVGKNPIGQKVYFQGATARNKALVAVFAEELEQPVHVSRYCHLTGALGAALILIDREIPRTQFSGIDFDYTAHEEICRYCANRCQLRVYKTRGQTVAWGMKCGKEYEERQNRENQQTSRLETAMLKFLPEKSAVEAKITIGIPLTLYLYEYHNLFQNFFEQLGARVILERSNLRTMKTGEFFVNSDFCSPIILTHGLIHSLLNKNPDYIFFPSFINERNLLGQQEEAEKFMDKESDAYFCYYSEYAPAIISQLTALDLQGKLISPQIKLNRQPVETAAQAVADALTGIFDQPAEKIVRLFTDCYKSFIQQKNDLKSFGQKRIEENPDKIKLLLLGRPYSLFENSVNCGIPAKLEAYGYELIHPSMLELSYHKEEDKLQLIDRMHWYYGQVILLALEYVSRYPNLYPVLLTCFRCSPDAYLVTYFKEAMKGIGKPYLILQLDEHASDVGYETRIEAGLETFEYDFRKKNTKGRIHYPAVKKDRIVPELTVLIPYLSPVISRLQQFAFEAYQYPARILPLEQKMINTGYRYASGGECMPNVAIAGSLIETVKREKLNPETVILYLPTLCIACNFNQFTILIQTACENAGLGGMRISNTNAARIIPELPKELNTALTTINILGSLLYKLYFRFHPYEINPGETEKALNDSLLLIREYLQQKKSLLEAAKELKPFFSRIKLSRHPRPRIGILGDLYVKYNAILNDDIYSLIEKQGGEVVIPSFTDTIAHFIDADIRENGLDPKYQRGLSLFEKRFEFIFEDLLEGNLEPPMAECVQLMHDFGIRHYIAGETALNVGRLLYYVKHHLVDAVVHVNPVFCCPGVVSTSLFRRIQAEFKIPVIDLFYDGTNKPNRLIIPHMHYTRIDLEN